MPACNITISAT